MLRDISNKNSSSASSAPANIFIEAEDPIRVEDFLSFPQTEIKPFVCDFQGCRRSYMTKKNLQYHKSNIHSSCKPLKCKYEGCAKSFMNQSKLRSHMRSHTKEKPFKCEECGKSFSEKGNLKIHFRVHSGERPYHCTFPSCKNSYKVQTHLSNHMRSHFNVRPYQCLICNKYFMRKNYLKRHQQLHSKIPLDMGELHGSRKDKVKEKFSICETSEGHGFSEGRFQIERSSITIIGGGFARERNEEKNTEILETNENE